ncbi:MAG: hypothetical protein L6R42_005942 [Xanthoria sp. 1 TBL-2021]|nr:MAG: hypothetical protein L6R42_005942 [Xanthoria sp. 1 TBL-2021]
MASCGKVLATGFNLHGQLEPGKSNKNDNLHHFTQIQKLDHVDCDRDRVIRCTLWSATIFNTGTLFLHRGISGTHPDRIHFDGLLDLEGRPKRGVFFGDVSGVKGFLDDSSGDLYMLQDDGKKDARFSRHCFQANDFIPRTGRKMSHAAIAGNMQVCVTTDCKDPAVCIFPNLKSLLQGSDPVEIYPSHQLVKSLVASSTTFTILGQQQPRLETFGDARYPALLGRTPSTQSPASLPTVISALDGINVAKIAAGSWLIAAVSCEKDLYVWGQVMQQPMGDNHSCFDKLLNNIGEDVHLIDIADGQDVEDVAIGDEHLVVLTTNGELWGYGSNDFGQLGLGRDVKTTQGEWVKIYAADAGEKIREFAAGPLSTFIVVRCHARGEQKRLDTSSGYRSDPAE